MWYLQYLLWHDFIYVTGRRYCSSSPRSSGRDRRSCPQRRHNKSTGAHRLIPADIHKICRERGREHDSVCYHIVAMVLRMWKHSRVPMTLPRQLGWLGKTSQASWCIFFPLFLKSFNSSSSLLGPRRSSHAKASFSLVVSCPLLSFVQLESFSLSTSSINQIVQVRHPSPLWELTGLCKELFV